MRLKNKVCVITGSSSGIGKKIAESFYAEGAKVIITYNKNKLEAKKLSKNLNSSFYKLDVFDKLSEKDWDLVLNVNLKGVFFCCQEVLKSMPNGGKIINIGSLSGEYGGPRTPSYAAAKAGVMSLTHCLARFVGKRKINVNCISPGVIDNEFTDKTMSKNVKGIIKSLLLIPRLGNLSDLTGAAVFLASKESDYVTGQTISINGGAWVR